MTYYKDKTGGLHVLDSADFEYLLPEDSTKLTDDEFKILSAPTEPTFDELAATARVKRDALIAETDYLVMPDYPISTDKLALVKTYRQLLRDITKQANFPKRIDWPPMPE